ncbi:MULTISPECIES: tetratricopeptide repeat protein [unclassified Anabaena]|uniref:tetratricopeptide repeat protein n=1 Tax=unclassified Anabaena TaxID=2619674 RepID=UPI0008355066|nr:MULTISPECIES: tetratricopeptide repeat protein [unclassified Anabaena]
MKRFISTAAATVTLVLSLSTQAISAVGTAHNQMKTSPITALDRQSSLELTINSHDAALYLTQGVLRLQSGDEKGAIAAFNQAIRINPNSSEAYFIRGIAHLQLEDWTAAVTDFNQAIRINPNSSEAYFIRGIARLQLGDLKGATEDLDQAAVLLEKQGKTAEYEQVINIINQINSRLTDAVIS